MNSSASLSIPLQWGRDLIVAETPRLPRRVQLQVLASMGPRLNSRGDCRFESCRARHCSASMGPRLNSRGDELIIDPDGPAEPSGLQWGRDLIVAETQLRLWLQGGARAGFNGAAT